MDTPTQKSCVDFKIQFWVHRGNYSSTILLDSSTRRWLNKPTLVTTASVLTSLETLCPYDRRYRLIVRITLHRYTRGQLIAVCLLVSTLYSRLSLSLFLVLLWISRTIYVLYIMVTMIPCMVYKLYYNQKARVRTYSTYMCINI